MKYTIDWKEYAGIAREAVAEGCVLLKNDSALPIKKDSKISIFGRIQFHYYKSGTGSGGMVNVPYVVSILDALKEEKDITINEDLLEEYKKWVDENPYNKGTGWANDPWCQEEMELTDEMVKKAAENSDEAVIIIGRTAGEDKDNSAKEGSYLLTAKEDAMLEKVCKYFDKTVVVLNVGNIIDMKWVAKYNPSAVLYAWQGGMEGGHGVADILLGRVNPCGKLADTIAYDYKDYPSTPNFNKNLTDVDASAYMELKHSGKLENNDRDVYEEDIYVGYRYFETIAKEKVLYPFGFGMSYTSFDIESECTYEDGLVKVVSKVTNTGEYAGKETVQIYYNPAQGKLSKPVRNLIEFAKTKVLMPGESQELSFEIDVNKMASYDDGGYTGHANSFVLEAGDYEIYAGNSVRDSKIAGSFNIPDLIVVKELEEALAPNYKFDRMVLKVEGDKVTKLSQSVPQRTIDLDKRILDNRPEDKPCTGDKGYKFINVAKGEVSIEDYLAQLTDEDLIHMSRGEGMCSSKVTAGIAGSYGGVTKRLHDVFGMPVAGLSDGPSGIRMDCGTEAFAMPNGTSLACTFNKELVNKLYQYAAKEIRFNKIDSLLGPGVNIHRNPLNGRNFEYFSEDPYLTGAMAVAQLKGLHTTKVTGTIKHFAGNNREFNRHLVNSTVSQRALREIYLKAFEMAVEEAGAYNIMTTYGLVNEIYTAGNYDLNTTILRGDWGFEGLVMTDWWAKINEEGKPGTIQNVGFMIRAQNDVYEVTADSENNGNNDDAMEKLAAGVITRGELLRNATNIVKSLLKAPVTDRLLNGEDDITEINKPESSKAKLNIMPAKEFIDDENLDIEEMSKYLKEYKGRSSTSCPGVADWLESFGDADEVFGVCLTSKISGGYNAAMTAAAQYMEEHPGRKVHMVDTHTTGPELEVLVEKLQELCATDKAFEEIVEEITEYNKHTNLMFALASVDNFAKNGRVNPLVAKAASVLGIRIVGRASEEGELEPISKIRGEKAAIAKLADYIVEEGFNGGRIIIRHSFNENAAKALADKILSKFPDCNLSIDINFGLCVYYAEPGSILVGFEN